MHHFSATTGRRRARAAIVALGSLTLLGICPGGQADPTRSTNIALTGNGTRLVNVNHEADSVTLFDVRGRSLRKVAEIPVGQEPHCVAVDPGGGDIFVTNGADGTVSVISSATRRVIKTIPVGTEPRGCAMTPNGERLFVANHTAGTVSVINTSSRRVINTVDLRVGGSLFNPFAIAITDGPGNNERVFVTDFYARLIDDPDAFDEGFDDGKQGIVRSFRVNNPNTTITTTTLVPLANSGFTANRTMFCQQLNANAVNNTFCPDPAAAPGSAVIVNNPQAVFPNQFFSALIRRNRLFLPNIGAQPEPPVNFRTNVQALVHVVNTTGTPAENQAEHVNLNIGINGDTTTGRLGKLFGNDIVAIDATSNGRTFFIVSRGGNYVLRATLPAAGGQLNVGTNVVRFETGNIPTGIVLGKRFAYVNNEIGHSVSVLDLRAGRTIKRDVASSQPPTPGSHEHAVELGKLVFFTALGVPDNGLVGQNIVTLDPLAFRGKQSSDAWSSCGSCHPAGLADGVTWIFADGPRNTLPLDALYSKINGAHDTRINNFSAARDSVTDFNANSRNVQCGTGFAGGATNAAIGCPPFGGGTLNPAVYDHGISQRASEALDFETQWAQTVRPLNVPQGDATAVNAGRTVFVTNCASCHGGAKWTKSQVFYLNNPALTRAFVLGDLPRDPLLTVTANQVVSYNGGGAPPSGVDTGTLQFLNIIGTFDPNGAIEVRGAGGAIGQRALGVLGFNVPSLLSTSFHAPYFHHGAAQTLEQVFALHQLPGGGTIQGLGGASNLLAFLRSIDGRTGIEESDGDIFKDPTRNITP